MHDYPHVCMCVAEMYNLLVRVILSCFVNKEIESIKLPDHVLHECFFVSSLIGLEETGIFRLPGQTSRVQALKDQYDQGILCIPAVRPHAPTHPHTLFL